LDFQVDWWLITIIIVLVAAFLVFVVFRIIHTYHSQVTTGKEVLKGKIALVKETLDPEGTVIYQGELWTAVSSSGRIEPEEEVTITKVNGLKLLVTKK
jgi:membrane-bound serine protease (ClpP class)